MEGCPQISSYLDYRLFLQDYYQYKKTTDPKFTYSYFAKKSGLLSLNYYKLVMDGQRNLTHKNIRKFCLGLKLEDKNALYFENLVFFNQAKKEGERTFYKKNLDMLLQSMTWTTLQKNQYSVYASCYPLIIKELLLIKNMDQNPKALAQRLNYAISPMQAQEMLDLLLKLKLIKKNSLGQYSGCSTPLKTPDTVLSSAAYRYHQKILGLAEIALKEQSETERCFSTLSVAVNKNDLEKAFQMIHEFRSTLDQMFMATPVYDAVYQLSIQLFRVDADV